MTRGLLKNAKIAYPSIFDGGAIIANPATGKILWQKLLSAESATQAAKILRPASGRLAAGGRSVLDQTSEISEPVTQVWASVPVDEAPSLVRQLNQLPESVAHINPGPGGDYTLAGIHVTHAQADKSHAVAELLRLQGVAKEQTLAIGDGDNDLPLFEKAGLKIAMGNSPDSVKSLADQVVGSVEDDGFTEAMDRFVLNTGA